MRRLALLAALALPAWGATYSVTVAGLGDESDYEQRFTSWAQDLDRLFGQAGDNVRAYTLSGGEATRERVRALFGQLATEVQPSDSIAVMLIGHGTHDGYEYKFNLPGPDITGAELAALLDKVPATRQLVANMTSSSGGSLETLRRKNRAVITATKSGTERNAVVFARYWVSALQDASADTDKNEAISALEAFEYAARKTSDFYETQNRLATEHPLIEDTGEGAGVRDPSPENGEGLLARQFILLRIGTAQLAAQDPEHRALLERKESLEQAIDKLKYEKAGMRLSDYTKQLTALLVDLAQTQQELDALEANRE